MNHGRFQSLFLLDERRYINMRNDFTDCILWFQSLFLLDERRYVREKHSFSIQPNMFQSLFLLDERRYLKAGRRQPNEIVFQSLFLLDERRYKLVELPLKKSESFNPCFCGFSEI